jgi:hypothetical protein
MRGLAKDPEARWPSCAAFVDALATTLKEAPTPAIASTVRVARAATSNAVAPRVESAAATVAVAYPEPDAAPIPVAAPIGPARSQSHQPRNAIVGVALIVLLLLIGGLAYVLTHQPPAISLSSTSVMPGQQLVVNATHVPANQTGVVEILSQRYTFPFIAGSNGSVNLEITVPVDISLGDHIVRICWNGACHSPTVLHVVSGVAQATPAATSSPRVSPTAGPTSTPRATPTLSPNPSRHAISVYPSSQAVLMTVTVTGLHFSPFRGVSIALFDPYNAARPLLFWSATTGSDGRFQKSIVIPANASPGTARITACDTNRLCASTTITVTG